MSTNSSAIDIPVDGVQLEGTLVTPGTLVPGVLLVHGWDGTQAQYVSRARDIAAMGAICLTFDLRGHVRHRDQRNSVSRDHNLRDVIAAYDVLAAHPMVDRRAIALVGSSYGGYLAAIATTMRPVRWLGLRVPALYRDEDWDVPKAKLERDRLAAFRQTSIPPDGNRALSACQAFRGDVLIVESEHDNLVPHPVIQNYIGACARRSRSLTYRVMVGADHALSEPECQRTYTSMLVGWMSEMFAATRGGKVGADSVADKVTDDPK